MNFKNTYKNTSLFLKINTQYKKNFKITIKPSAKNLCSYLKKSKKSYNKKIKIKNLKY